jgi:8-oxo-dGTP diphosphatase
MKETVLCYIEKNGKYLMLFRNKKENDINSGKYIGVGGHIELGETKEEALIREVKEETNLDVINYEYFGKVFFKDDDFEENMYLFTVTEFKGELKECDEGELHWINKENILDVPHWEGDKYFLEKIKNNEKGFEMSLIYSKGQLIKII